MANLDNYFHETRWMDGIASSNCTFDLPTAKRRAFTVSKLTFSRSHRLTCIVRQHVKTVKKLSTHTYQDQLMRLMKKNQPGFKYIWRFHRELSPTRVISIRGTEGYLAVEDPKFGNRMMVHALVRIDSEQVCLHFLLPALVILIFFCRV